MRLIKILERIFMTIPIMLGVAILVFTAMRFIPGDPVDVMYGESGFITEDQLEQLRQELNLDKPFHVQLYLFLSGLVQGDLGMSYVKRRPVWDLILERLPATVELAFGALLFGLIIAIPIGIISAVKQYSIIDRTSMAVAFVGISIPGFILGLMLILIFSVTLKLLPTAGRIDPILGLELHDITGLHILDSIISGNFRALLDSIKHLILPSIALGAVLGAIVARVLRSSMIEVLRADYVTLARAKGLRGFIVVTKHALRNALIPTVTVVGIQIGVLLGGNMIIESVFAWPGMGRLAVDAIKQSDYSVIQGVVMIYALTFVVANLLVDILYTFLNPRIKL